MRAIAIALVFSVHAELFGFGWIGVPVFFVLSGFLITGILRKSRTDAAFWAPFYIKRASRILPPLVIAALGAAAVFDIPWRKIGLYELFFLANVVEVLYPKASKTLGVLWSLAVEEHFYLLWPFAVRFLRRRSLLILLGLMLIVEPILRAIATPIFHTFWPIFLLTPFQLDGLVAGSLLALLLENEQNTKWLTRLAGPTALASLTLFVGLSFTRSFHREANSLSFNSIGYSLLTLGAVSVIAYTIVAPRSLLSTLLAGRAMTFTGKISYGLYLFHPLALLLAYHVALTCGIVHLRLFTPLAALIAWTFSWLSFKYYEEPILLWGRRRARTTTQQKSLLLGKAMERV